MKACLRCLVLCCSRCMNACFTSRSSSRRVLLEAGQGIPVLQQSNEHWRDEAFALHGQQTANLSRSNSNLPASNAAGPGVSRPCSASRHLACPSHSIINECWLRLRDNTSPLVVMSAGCGLLKLLTRLSCCLSASHCLQSCQARLLAQLMHSVQHTTCAAQPSCKPLGQGPACYPSAESGCRIPSFAMPRPRFAALALVLPPCRSQAVLLLDRPTASRGDPGCNGLCAVNAGVKLYHLPMGAGQTKGDALHGWGSAHDAFWCCYGSSVESFAKLADSIYFFRWGAYGS